MKVIASLFLVCLIAASLSHAQSDSISTLLTKTDERSPNFETSSSQSLKTSTGESTDKNKSQFIAEFWAETSATVQSASDHGGAAGISTQYTVGLGYKLTSKMSVGIQQLAFSRSNFNDMAGPDVDVFQNGNSDEAPQQQALGDLILKSVYTTESRILGSEPWTPTTRYYIGTSKSARGLGRVGYLRFDLGPSWVLNPHFNLDFALSPRLTFNNSRSKRGSDAIYHLTTGPTLTYNFSDTLNAYSQAQMILYSTEAQRGRSTMDVANLFNSEIGLNWVLGKVTINPAIASYADLNGSEGKVFSSESRIYAAENSIYSLNVYANF